MKESLKKFIHLFGRKGRFKFGVLLGLMMINAVLEMVGVGAIPLFVMVLSNPDAILGGLSYLFIRHTSKKN